MIHKADLIRRVWEKVNAGREGYKERLRMEDIELIINTMFKEMSQCMIDGVDINIRSFGKFVSNIRKERIGFDQIHKKTVLLPERRVIKFNIAKDVDKIIKGERNNE